MYRHPQLDAILAELKAGLQALYGERLSQVILYGSQARGDAEEFSDIDVMIVLKGDFDLWEEKNRSSHFVADLSLKYDAVISRFFVNEEALQTPDTGLMINVRQEGIPI